MFLGLVSLQSILYKMQTGHYLLYSYGDESFNFSKPEIINFLISYRKGFFLYTPIALLSIFGFRTLYRENKYRAIVLSLFLLFITYVFSSWWSWWYGGSFSTRVLLEYSLFVFLPLAVLLNDSTAKIRRRLTILMVVLTLFSQVQIYQFRHGQIHYSDMTKELYWKNFLRIDKL